MVLIYGKKYLYRTGTIYLLPTRQCCGAGTYWPEPVGTLKDRLRLQLTVDEKRKNSER